MTLPIYRIYLAMCENIFHFSGPTGIRRSSTATLFIALHNKGIRAQQNTAMLSAMKYAVGIGACSIGNSISQAVPFKSEPPRRYMTAVLAIQKKQCPG